MNTQGISMCIWEGTERKQVIRKMLSMYHSDSLDSLRKPSEGEPNKKT
jgi:hypothetical protein